MRVAKKTGNDALWQFGRMRLAHNRARRPDQSLIKGTYYTQRTLRALFDWDESLYADQSDTASLGHWFGGIQVATARTEENRFDGLFLAAKGGCNAESTTTTSAITSSMRAASRPLWTRAWASTPERPSARSAIPSGRCSPAGTTPPC